MGLDVCACPNCDCPETLMPRFGGASSVCGMCLHNQCKAVADEAISEMLSDIRQIVTTLSATGKKFIDSEDVAKALKTQRRFVHATDAYGSLHDRSSGVIMLNAYGDENTYPDGVAYCACLLSSYWEWHLIDIAPSGEIINKTVKPVPQEARVSVYYAKRAFYWDRKNNRLSLRCKPDDYQKIPEQYRDTAFENNVSGPRLVLA